MDLLGINHSPPPLTHTGSSSSYYGIWADRCGIRFLYFWTGVRQVWRGAARQNHIYAPYPNCRTLERILVCLTLLVTRSPTRWLDRWTDVNTIYLWRPTFRWWNRRMRRRKMPIWIEVELRKAVCIWCISVYLPAYGGSLDSPCYQRYDP